LGKKAYRKPARRHKIRKAGVGLMNAKSPHSILSFRSVGSILSAGSILSIASAGYRPSREREDQEEP
jgi:hypothetical protein